MSVEIQNIGLGAMITGGGSILFGGLFYSQPTAKCLFSKKNFDQFKETKSQLDNLYSLCMKGYKFECDRENILNLEYYSSNRFMNKKTGQQFMNAKYANEMHLSGKISFPELRANMRIIRTTLKMGIEAALERDEICRFLWRKRTFYKIGFPAIGIGALIWAYGKITA